MRLVIVMFAVACFTGCETLPRDAFRLSETALETRQVQTRTYEDVTDLQILSASSALLQDLGYAIDEIEKPLGVISASKRADARKTSQVARTLTADATQCLLTFFLACEGKRFKATDDIQDIRLTLVALPVHSDEKLFSVRVTMQRIVWDRESRLSEQETISDADVYEAFFAQLSKSVFLEREGV